MPRDYSPTRARSATRTRRAASTEGACAVELHRKLEAGERPFILDARSLDEYEQMRLGIGERLIPLGALRGRLEELPPEKDKEVICTCKISLRGYEAARILEGRGWTNVKVLEGGIVAWPYPRETSRT